MPRGDTAVQPARSESFAIWTLAFRPFFLVASVWSAAALTGSGLR